MNQFRDINTKEEVSKLKDEDYIKYNKYGIDAIKETIGRHKSGRFDDQTTIERDESVE